MFSVKGYLIMINHDNNIIMHTRAFMTSLRNVSIVTRKENPSTQSYIDMVNNNRFHESRAFILRIMKSATRVIFNSRRLAKSSFTHCPYTGKIEDIII